MSEQYTHSTPRHVGIIMDGNGRWARARGLPRSMGHKQGAETFGTLVRHARDIGLPFLTVYAFSTENWRRPPDEVRGIMDLLRSYLRNAKKYEKENVRTRVIGERAPLDGEMCELIERVEQGSRRNTGITVNIALSYGGRDEILHAAKALARQAADGLLDPDALTGETFAGYLYTAGQPDADLIIRTGGERRVSNFLLWQGSYAELYFTDTLWPDFTPADLDAALRDFASRERRMGGL